MIGKHRQRVEWWLLIARTETVELAIFMFQHVKRLFTLFSTYSAERCKDTYPFRLLLKFWLEMKPVYERKQQLRTKSLVLTVFTKFKFWYVQTRKHSALTRCLFFGWIFFWMMKGKGKANTYSTNEWIVRGIDLRQGNDTISSNMIWNDACGFFFASLLFVVHDGIASVAVFEAIQPKIYSNMNIQGSENRGFVLIFSIFDLCKGNDLLSCSLPLSLSCARPQSLVYSHNTANFHSHFHTFHTHLSFDSITHFTFVLYFY